MGALSLNTLLLLHSILCCVYILVAVYITIQKLAEMRAPDTLKLKVQNMMIEEEQGNFENGASLNVQYIQVGGR